MPKCLVYVNIGASGFWHGGRKLGVSPLTPAITHASILGPKEPADMAIWPGVVKIPEPMTVPTRIHTAEKSPISRFSSFLYKIARREILPDTSLKRRYDYNESFDID